MNDLATILIYVHASFGALALFAGVWALVSKKGGRHHKKSGLIFYYSMLISALIAFIVAVMPQHESPFLFSIGMFSTYFLIAGKRSLSFKNKTHNYGIDIFLAYSVLLVGLAMVLYPILLEGRPNVVLLVFGAVGMLFGIRDLLLYRNLARVGQKWLQLHIGKMMGGYIAAVTAFFVVNQTLPGLLNWFLPGILGSFYISYWMFKLKSKKIKKQLPK